MFQYDAVADTWTQIGRMESLRFAHGVVAANLSAIGCTAYNAKGESRSLLDARNCHKNGFCAKELVNQYPGGAAIHGVSRFVALLIGFSLAIVI